MPDVSIPINLIFEDDLQLAVLERLLKFSGRNFKIGRSFKGFGNGYIKKTIKSFNHAARAMPYLAITDLDDSRCAPEKIRNWLNVEKHQNLIFRVAVHDVEAWILADRENLSKFLGVSYSRIHTNTESLQRGKHHLRELIKRSRKTNLKREMLPSPGSTAKIGPNYNFYLTQFVMTEWDPAQARIHSDSLRRAIDSLRNFQPQWQ